MVISIPTAGETTSIGLPAITVPVTATGERPLTQEDMNTIAQLSDTSALLIATRGADGARDAASDIVLDDNTVSREHTIFKRSGSVFTVEDAGSLNGTYVNRERVDSARLNSGDEIIIGRFRFAFFTKSPAVVQ